MIESVRRVVMRPGPDGRLAVAFDGASPHVHTLPGMSPDLGLTDLWYTDTTAATPTGGDAADRDLAVAPTPGGTLFRVVQFPPDADDPAAPFWHETETVDYSVLLSGELVLLTEASEVQLAPGDTLVVCGGRHAWSNRTTDKAILVTVGVGAIA